MIPSDWETEVFYLGLNGHSAGTGTRQKQHTAIKNENGRLLGFVPQSPRSACVSYLTTECVYRHVRHYPAQQESCFTS